MIDANGKEANGYQIPKIEAHLIHLSIEDVDFDKRTGVRKSQPFYQSFTLSEFNAAEKSRAFAGMEVKVMHKPDGSTVTPNNVIPDAAVEPTTIPDKIDGESELGLLQGKYFGITGKELPAHFSLAQANGAVMAAEGGLARLQSQPENKNADPQELLQKADELATQAGEQTPITTDNNPHSPVAKAIADAGGQGEGNPEGGALDSSRKETGESGEGAKQPAPGTPEADEQLAKLREEFETVTGDKPGNRKAETLRTAIDEANAAKALLGGKRE